MSRSADVTLRWGDGTHKFRLAYGELRELQEKTQAGPFIVLTRLETGGWLVDDIVETLRLGLIGGGMKALDALTLVERYVKDRPDWMLNAKTAVGVLGAALLGVRGEPLGKDTAGGGKRKRRKSRSQTASGVSASSTETPPPPSAGMHESSTD